MPPPGPKIVKPNHTADFLGNIGSYGAFYWLCLDDPDRSLNQACGVIHK